MWLKFNFVLKTITKQKLSLKYYLFLLCILGWVLSNSCDCKYSAFYNLPQIRTRTSIRFLPIHCKKLLRKLIGAKRIVGQKFNKQQLLSVQMPL